MMDGTPSSFWGKLRQDDAGKVVAWHPLVDHCADVAAVGEALLEVPTWRCRLARLAGVDVLDATICARLSVLIALHDLGKLNLGFQAKGRPEFGLTAGHVVEALGAIGRPALASIEPLAAWGDATTGLLATSICHHGRPYRLRDANEFQSAWWTPRCGLNPAAGAADLLERCREWFPLAFVDGRGPLPATAAFEHAFAGLVTLADWIASDTDFFRYTEPSDGDRMAFARAKAHQILLEMGIDIDDRLRISDEGRDAFARVAPGLVPRPAQAVIVGLAPADRGITVLESETGSGKTEAALAHFVALFLRGSVDGLYFALPTRTAATQIFRRVRDAVASAFTEPPPVVLAVPGYLHVDHVKGRYLTAFDVLWPDIDRFRYRGWAAEHPKRFLAGAIVVGTIDQVLLSALTVNHSHLRATALLRHLLVVDEVHSSDTYMTRILESVLAHHVDAGGHALLLSATLGAEARSRLLQPRTSAVKPTLEEAIATPYPLVSTSGGLIRVGDDTASRRIEIEAASWLEDFDAVVAHALAAAQGGAKVLVVKNTVRDCVSTQEALESACRDETVLFKCEDVVAPHHARFARVDREALDHALEQRFGKQRLDGGCIVIATQTVQQSLDIDADLLLTDLCPVDVLLQRIGRLHRHPRVRPAGSERPRAVVIVPASRDLGSLIDAGGRARHHHGLGSVYEDLRVLEATWRAIEEHSTWRIPEMSRLLIESCVHSQRLASIAAAGGEQWKQHEMQMIGTACGLRRQAELCLVDWSKPYSECGFPTDLAGRISTRLGEGDRLVSFDPPFVGPFGTRVGELALCAWWVKGVDAQESASSDVRTADRATHFRFGGRRFVYNRLGLRPEPRGEKSGEDLASTEVSLDDDGP